MKITLAITEEVNKETGEALRVWDGLGSTRALTQFWFCTVSLEKPLSLNPVSMRCLFLLGTGAVLGRLYWNHRWQAITRNSWACIGSRVSTQSLISVSSVLKGNKIGYLNLELLNLEYVLPAFRKTVLKKLTCPYGELRRDVTQRFHITEETVTKRRSSFVLF